MTENSQKTIAQAGNTNTTTTTKWNNQMEQPTQTKNDAFKELIATNNADKVLSLIKNTNPKAFFTQESMSVSEFNDRLALILEKVLSVLDPNHALYLEYDDFIRVYTTAYNDVDLCDEAFLEIPICGFAEIAMFGLEHWDIEDELGIVLHHDDRNKQFPTDLLLEIQDKSNGRTGNALWIFAFGLQKCVAMFKNNQKLFEILQKYDANFDPTQAVLHLYHVWKKSESRVELEIAPNVFIGYDMNLFGSVVGDIVLGNASAYKIIDGKKIDLFA